jgi:hypothetical protein
LLIFACDLTVPDEQSFQLQPEDPAAEDHWFCAVTGSLEQ